MYHAFYTSYSDSSCIFSTQNMKSAILQRALISLVKLKTYPAELPVDNSIRSQNLGPGIHIGLFSF